VYASSGNYLGADINAGTTMTGEGDFYAVPHPNPGTRRDWDDLLDMYFGDGGYLESLNATLESLKKVLPAPEHKHNVVLLVPYPGIAQSHWGRLPDGVRTLNFSVTGQGITPASEDRLAALRWFAGECTARWSDERFPHLNFLGFYWPFETVYRGWDVDDHWVLKEFHKHLKSLDKRFMWIPFFATYNVHLLDNYQDYYFDLAFQQPNHMFYVNTPGIEAPALAAKARNAGFEMEYFGGGFGDPAVQADRHNRFRDYLNGGVEFGYMKESPCAWYQDFDLIARMRTHENPVERALYHDIYKFIKGSYEYVGK